MDYLSWQQQNARNIADDLLDKFLTRDDDIAYKYFSEEDREKMVEVYDMLYDFSEWDGQL